MERRFPKGMVIAYAAPSPLALIHLAGKAAKEMAQVLNLASIEVGAATAPLTQDDLEQAAPDTEVQPRGPKAEHEVGPVTTQRAPAQFGRHPAPHCQNTRKTLWIFRTSPTKS